MTDCEKLRADIEIGNELGNGQLYSNKNGAVFVLLMLPGGLWCMAALTITLKNTGFPMVRTDVDGKYVLTADEVTRYIEDNRYRFRGFAEVTEGALP